MPLYGDLEVRSPRLGRGDVLPSYSPRLGPETLEAGPRVDYGDLALEAAQAGSLGGPVAGGLSRLPGEAAGIRSSVAATSDELFNQEALAQAIKANRTPKNRTMFTRMHPDDFLALARDFGDRPEYGTSKHGWVNNKPAGHSPRHYEGVRSAIESGTPLADIPRLEMADAWTGKGLEPGRILGHEGRHRASVLRDMGYKTMPVELTANTGLRWGEQLDPSGFDYHEELPRRLGSESPKYESPAHRTRPVPFHTEGPMRGLPLEAPAVRRPLAVRAAAGAGRLAKSVLSPASLLADATIGAGVGAGSALAGYESARPRSAGIFTPPNPRYEGVIDPATIERIAEQGEIENELERQRLIQQYNALGYDIDPDTRLRDLRR